MDRDPTSKLLDDARRQLAALERENAHARELIDALRAHISRVEGRAPAPAPAVPAQTTPTPPGSPHSRRRGSGLPPEQRALRVVAGLGGLISAIGVILAVVWAFQTGLLRPPGIALLGVILSGSLAAAGLAARSRFGPSFGVTATFSASFISAVSVMFYVTSNVWRGTSISVSSAIHLVLWLVFLGLAYTQRDHRLLRFMLVIFLIYEFALVDDHLAANLCALLVPLVTVGACSLPRLCGAGGQSRATGALASAVYAVGTFLIVFVTDTGYNVAASAAAHYVLIALGAALFVVIGSRAHASPARGAQGAEVLGLAVFPLTSLVLVMLFARLHFVPWFIVAATAGIAAFMVLRFRTGGPGAGLHRRLAGWWLAALAPVTAGARVVSGHLLNGDPPSSHFTAGLLASLAVYVLLFCGVALLLRLLPPVPGDEGVVVAWILGYVLATVFAQEMLRDAGAWHPGSARMVGESLITAAFLASSLYFRDLFPRLGNGARVICGIALVGETLPVILPPVGSLVAEMPGADPATGFWAGHAVTSVLWILTATVLLLAPRARASGSATLGLGILFAVLASLKLVFFDLDSSSEITRIIAFVVCGALLLAIAVVRSRRDPEPAPEPATGGSGSGTAR